MPGGFGFPLGFVTCVLATTATIAAGATTHPLLALITLAGVVLAIAAISTATAAIATAAVGWALHAGFVLGRHGDLAFTPQSTRDAAVLGAVALLAALVTALVRIPRVRIHATTVDIPAPRPAGATTTLSADALITHHLRDP